MIPASIGSVTTRKHCFTPSSEDEIQALSNLFLRPEFERTLAGHIKLHKIVNTDYDFIHTTLPMDQYPTDEGDYTEEQRYHASYYGAIYGCPHAVPTSFLCLGAVNVGDESQDVDECEDDLPGTKRARLVGMHVAKIFLENINCLQNVRGYCVSRQGEWFLPFVQDSSSTAHQLAKATILSNYLRQVSANQREDRERTTAMLKQNKMEHVEPTITEKSVNHDATYALVDCDLKCKPPPQWLSFEHYHYNRQYMDTILAHPDPYTAKFITLEKSGQVYQSKRPSPHVPVSIPQGGKGFVVFCHIPADGYGNHICMCKISYFNVNHNVCIRVAEALRDAYNNLFDFHVLPIGERRTFPTTPLSDQEDIKAGCPIIRDPEMQALIDQIQDAK